MKSPFIPAVSFLVGVLAFAVLLPAAVVAVENKPNIILIVADDMGYGDPGCYGGTAVPTPNIDRLARGGVRFTDAYVTAPLCAPSRCGILTGAYNQRFGMRTNTDNRYKLPADQKVLPEALASAGYLTAHFGKWNISRPAKVACVEVYDLMDFAAAYVPNAKGQFPGVDGVPMDKSTPWGWDEDGSHGYLTDRISDDAVSFIDRHVGDRFFMYLGYNAPHSPFQAPASYRERFPQAPDLPNQVYDAMVACLDEGIGRVLASLERHGLLENTLVVFTSDNGPTRGAREIINWPADWAEVPLIGSAGSLRGHKGNLLEGGIREPFIMHWPARLKGGATYRKPVSTLDLYPTFCEAGGATLPSGTVLDGVSLLPFLDDGPEKSGTPHDRLFWDFGAGYAVRWGDWKLLGDSKEQSVQLFNLRADQGEREDLAAQHPEIVSRLTADWKAWQASLH